MNRVCECKWQLVEENAHAIRVSVFKDHRRPIWLGKKRIKITKREDGMISFEMEFIDARKKGII